MRILIQSVQRKQSGWILAVTMTFLLVTLIVFASIMYWVTSSARVTQRNNLFNVSEAAAQGAAESAVTAMNRDFISQNINPASVYQTSVTNIDQTSWPVKFTFSDTNGNANQIYVSIYPQDWSTNYQNLNAQFSGLYAAVANCDVIAVATPTNTGMDMSAVVEEKSQLAAIPVFQFGVFYNLDLDFSPGQALTMNGKVHVNGTLWMYPQAAAVFNDSVEATVIVTNKDNPNDQQNMTSYTTPITYNGGNPLSGVDTIAMPINGSGSNVEAIINLPPAGIAAPATAAYDPTNQIYLYNKCDLIISNSSSGINGAFGTNVTIFYQDSHRSPVLQQLTNNEICTFNKTNGPASLPQYWTTNSPMRPTTNYASIPIASSFPFVTNVTFFDYRESDTVQALQIDIAKLTNWLSNPNLEGSNWNYVCGGSYGMGGSSAYTGIKGHPLDAIFVYNSVPRTSSQLPAVRVVNGAQLPTHWGLTIATPFPLYTLGDYNIKTNSSGSTSQTTTNTAWTWPAALMGDAITILSGSWDDGYSLSNTAVSSGTLGGRNATTTTVNAAMLEGIVPSITVASGTYAGKHYSGGLENFLRMLESWSGDSLWYNGSIVVMFPSIYATNFWIGPGTYYNPPTRKWGFDSNFKSPTGMPPAAPQAKAIIRGNWNSNGK